MQTLSNGHTLVTAGPVLQIHFSNIMFRIFRISTLLMATISLTTPCMSAQEQTHNGNAWTLSVLKRANAVSIILIFSLKKSTESWHWLWCHWHNKSFTSGLAGVSTHLDTSDLLCLWSAPRHCCARTEPRWAAPAARWASGVRGCSAGWISRCSRWQSVGTAASAWTGRSPLWPALPPAQGQTRVNEHRANTKTWKKHYTPQNFKYWLQGWDPSATPPRESNRTWGTASSHSLWRATTTIQECISR